jgi:hypothetical protein
MSVQVMREAIPNINSLCFYMLSSQMPQYTNRYSNVSKNPFKIMIALTNYVKANKIQSFERNMVAGSFRIFLKVFKNPTKSDEKQDQLIIKVERCLILVTDPIYKDLYQKKLVARLLDIQSMRPIAQSVIEIIAGYAIPNEEEFGKFRIEMAAEEEKACLPN